MQRDGIDRIRLARQRSECRPAVGEGVDADAEPGDGDAACDADEAEEENDGDLERGIVLAGFIGGEPAEIDDEDRADEYF